MTSKEEDQAIALSAMETIEKITHRLSQLGDICPELAADINLAMLPHSKKLAYDLSQDGQAKNKELS